MGSYYSSNNVRIFPSTYRSEYINGKLTSENNFINILNSITDIDSYVLDYSNEVLKVVIHGYYFEITGVKSSNNLWLHIVIENSKNYGLVTVVDKSTTLDQGELFLGLYCSDSAGIGTALGENYKSYSLQVFKNGEICNKVRLVTDSIQYNNDRDLTSELNAKQYILTNEDEDGYGISVTNEYDNSKIKLNTKTANSLKSLKSKGGNESNPELFKSDSNGVFSTNAANIGEKFTKVTDTDYYYKNIYIENGVFKTGNTVFASTQSPDDTKGSNGDIWFKYNNN